MEAGVNWCITWTVSCARIKKDLGTFLLGTIFQSYNYIFFCLPEMKKVNCSLCTIYGSFKQYPMQTFFSKRL